MTHSVITPDGGLAPAIRLRNLRKSYIKGIPVLDEVDLDVPHGKVTALVGANGSGKSTLVKILSGYHFPLRGHDRLISPVSDPGKTCRLRHRQCCE